MKKSSFLYISKYLKDNIFFSYYTFSIYMVKHFIKIL